MAWLRAGTVAVTNGTTTVTGTGTGFAANTRVGDAFIGPDGRQYELVNVASDTVISITPAYQGATASGASYAIMPVQGYQKLLADQVRDWVNTYGTKMAALGTTGNYDTLPVTKGGTGGTTQAQARTGLGLGTAATADAATFVAKTASGVSTNAAPDAAGYDNPGQAQGGGFYKIGGGASSSGLTYAAMIRAPYAANYEAQIYFPMGATTNKIYFRCALGASGGTLGTAQEIYHTGNTTRGSGGVLSAASPIVRIANVTDSDRGDLQEQTFEPAGAWGVANEEARGVSVERLGVGEYRVTGSLGLALEGWRTQDPCSPDGGGTLGITESQQAEDGAITIKLFKQRWTLSEDGEMIPGRGAPLDVPLNTWIDVRLEMPQPETPPPPATLETE
ncbi:tail fiber domain-containing protein [Pseudomonas chlororaphis subsp. aurantiaca]|uniref:phage tail fiber protein n=1 Tax=Pseudomonas chlororaphis TaxID=587753 RepID=UPI0008662A76|nr:hypothetical protein [Pseudomonas chlororaphis]BAV74221.1 tail fiber domain-containing protein [Pseudomonas chlororaphis subsp. aurantiaca]